MENPIGILMSIFNNIDENLTPCVLYMCTILY